MKKTKTNKKMHLNKTTVSNLKMDDMQKMRGGVEGGDDFSYPLYCKKKQPLSTCAECCFYA